MYARCQEEQCLPEHIAYCDATGCFNECGGREPSRAYIGEPCGSHAQWICVGEDVACVQTGIPSPVQR